MVWIVVDRAVGDTTRNVEVEDDRVTGEKEGCTSHLEKSLGVAIASTEGSGGSLVMESAEKADAIGSRLPAEAMKMLQSLASHWDDIVDVIRLKGAMTNEVYQIKWPTNKEHSRKVLVRIYGEGVDVFFDRELEIRTFEFMSKQGKGPRLLGRFRNGRIEEFIRARTLSAHDLRDPDISALVASKLREFHDLDMSGPKKAMVWDRLRNWLSAAKSMCSADETKTLRLDAMEEEIETLHKCLAADQRIAFCHNDLQYGNIMIDEETRSITIIDYEYACYNPSMFDFANHFCEMAADYHTETPHLLDYSKYPGKVHLLVFAEKPYENASAPFELQLHQVLKSVEGNELEVDEMLEEIEKYTLASHLHWGLWGEHVNEIDFDYMEYARQRFQEYWLQKPKILGS
ncbi:Choline/Ethanolamine kinase [Cynara cardunculus var. scolymus]|uniref:Choline/Ethanolamine kinase n=1 Tax=Cynara cardunculus var. scolymus TaxID=59895 RepID=A0A103Y1L7_CYNCS|nr:Choline/Ethanolamine kinase [Cynara cardunculus var. scolymus]